MTKGRDTMIMNFIKSFLGYIWVVLAIAVSILGFKDMGRYEQWVAQKSGFRLSENWTGGKIDAVVNHSGYQTVIHQPVFAGLIGRPNQGFIQIDWVGADGIPQKIDEEIDYDHDRRVDFAIRLDTVKNTVVMKPFSNRVTAVKDQEVLVYKDSRTIKVLIKREI